jgi:hypothetical protein
MVVPAMSGSSRVVRQGRRCTGGNAADVTQLILLVEAVPPIRGRRGRPRQRPGELVADRGYDHDTYRLLRARGITPRIARRYRSLPT